MIPNPIKMDDLGVPLFLETPIYIYIIYTSVVCFFCVFYCEPSGSWSYTCFICKPRQNGQKREFREGNYHQKGEFSIVKATHYLSEL